MSSEQLHENKIYHFNRGGHDHDGINSTPVKLLPGSVEMGHLSESVIDLIEQRGGDGNEDGSSDIIPVPDLVIETGSVAAGGSIQGVIDWTTMCVVRSTRILMTVETECTITFYHKGTFADEDREFRATNCGNKFMWEGPWAHYDEDLQKKIYYKVQNTGTQTSSFQITLKSGTMTANEYGDFIQGITAAGKEFSGAMNIAAGNGVQLEADDQSNTLTVHAGDVNIEYASRSKWSLTPVRPANVTGSVALTSNGGSVLGYAQDGYTHDTNRYINFGSSTNWINFDLGAVKTLGQIGVIFYFGDGRTFYDVKVEISQDNVNWSTVKSAGPVWSTGEQMRVTNLSGMLARYIRIWSNGSSASAGNHIVKCIAYAIGDK